MKRFAELFMKLDQTTKTTVKIDVLADYFREAPDSDKVWCIALLSGKRPKRPVKTTFLRQWAAELAGLPDWLFEESYHVVGDLGETVALVLPDPESTEERSLTEIMELIIELREKTDEEKKKWVQSEWMKQSRNERFVFNKLMTGISRIGVSQKNMVKALAKYTERDESVLAHRLMGNWTPTEYTFSRLILEERKEDDLSRPYPFYLAYPLEEKPEELGDPSDWQVEWKWDGIRGQVVIREGQIFVWSRGEELVTDKFPELHSLKDTVPDGTVIDGEIICHDGEQPLPFHLLQTRIGRKNVSAKTMKKAPVKIIAYDLLEHQNEDVREVELGKRRAWLEQIVEKASVDELLISKVLEEKDWSSLAEKREGSREMRSEGLMIKKKDSNYKVGRKRGDWWKWKVDPLTIDAVLIYAMRGHGRRANLYTDYTFAVWDGDELVPVTKAYSGLTDKEFNQVDRFVKKNTVDRFGPVRSVKPELVFEIAFEGIAESNRHKSGVALRFPRMHRWRTDKPAEEANTKADLLKLLDKFG
ncbi:ATP-dependent DNA ligase [Halocola ammonii]